MSKGEETNKGKSIRCLIVEDDFYSRNLLNKYLEGHFDCDLAVDGNEAIVAFQKALSENNPYKLIMLDILMPNLNGHDTLRFIREIENDNGIFGLDGVKVVMTTAYGDSRNVMSAFRNGCESYLVKPILKNQVMEELQKLNMFCETAN